TYYSVFLSLLCCKFSGFTTEGGREPSTIQESAATRLLIHSLPSPQSTGEYLQVFPSKGQTRPKPYLMHWLIQSALTKLWSAEVLKLLSLLKQAQI
uniref:Uncharacterized protein n=1 Tax=Amazona collaria TaxID=241587 RepID=A0A8B9GSI8_9PSIT